MKKRVLPLLLTALLLLSACAGGGTSRPAPAPADSGESWAPEPTPAPESEPEDEPEDEPEEPAFDVTAGPILMEGSFQEGFTASQLDLASGELTPFFWFSNKVGKTYSTAFDADASNYLGSYFTKQLFDENMTKLAVSWYDETDASYRVGWVDREGNLTDVSKIVHPHTSDFSSRVPNDAYPLFSPDGYFFFADRNESCYHYFDTETMSVVKSEPFIIDHGTYSDNPAPNVVFMPDGSLQKVWHTEQGGAASNVDFGEYWLVLPAGPRSSGAFQTWDYVGDGVILCVGRVNNLVDGRWFDGYGDYFIAEIGKGISVIPPDYCVKYIDHGGPATKPVYYWDFPEYMQHRRITPTTDYCLDRCAYSAAHDLIAFTGTRGEERFLFTVPNAENAEPAQVAAIPTDIQLLFWK